MESGAAKEAAEPVQKARCQEGFLRQESEGAIILDSSGMI